MPWLRPLLASVALFAVSAPGATRSDEVTAFNRTVTVTEGTNLAATVAPNHRAIVMDLQGSLWTLPFSGGIARQLTDPFLEPARPDYSPKGDAIAFQAFKDGAFHIWMMRPDGSGLRQLTTGHGDDREPRFSPDGVKIAFSSDRAFKGSYDIWMLDIATGALSQETSSVADEYEPAWSPDGSEIAYISGTGANGTAVQAINMKGVARTLVTAPAGARLNSPSWSPDGKRIAYTQFAKGNSQLFVSGARVGNSEDVFPFPAAWLSNSRLLYSAEGKIQLIDLDGSQPGQINFEAAFALHRPAYKRKVYNLASKAPKPVLGIVSPTLSPDGRQIVFEALNQLWLMKIGAKPERLTDDSFYKEDPSWSPDGKRIAYSSDKDGLEALYVLDLTSKHETRVTSPTEMAQVSSAWSPDGRMLAFQDQAGATYTVDLATSSVRKVIPAQFAPAKPSWSASGRAISIGALKAYTRRFREGTSQILTVNLDTGALTYTEPAPFESLSTRGEDGPLYSPDGSSVAFVMKSVLWIRPVDAKGIPTGAARQVTAEVTDAPSWSGDSKQLLYLSNGKLRLTEINRATARTIPLDMTWRQAQTPTRMLIHAGRLWNGVGADIQSDVDILIADNRIQSVQPHSASHYTRAAAEHTQIVDASKLTVTPGLWESHTHEWIEGKFYGDRLGRLWLAYGVTELQSQGDPVYRSVETREAFDSGARLGPHFFATGEAIDGERIYYNFMRPVTSQEQLNLELSRAKSLEYDNLKTYVRLPHAMQQKVAQFGHEQMGVTTASHYMLPGLAVGVDGMTHLSATARLGFAYTRSAAGFTYQDVKSLFEATGEYIISTPFTSFPLYAEDPGMIDDARLRALNTPWDEEVLHVKLDLARGKHPHMPEGMHLLGADPAVTLKSLEREEQSVASVLHGGGIVLAGTDSPLDNVATALHLNLRAQVKYGLKPWEALQTATILPARALGHSDDLGTVEPGKIADLVLVSGNPLVDIKDMANVQSVVKDGKIYSVSDLLKPFSEPTTALPPKSVDKGF